MVPIYPRSRPCASVSRCGQGQQCGSHLALEAVFPRLIDVPRQASRAGPPESRARVEPVRLIEARVRPEDQTGDPPGPAPVQHCADKGAARAVPPQIGVEIKTVELGGVGIEPLDAHRPDDQAPLADDEEFPTRRLVVTVEGPEIGNLRGGLEDESILGEHPADEGDDAGSVGSRSGLYGQPTVSHGRQPTTAGNARPRARGRARQSPTAGTGYCRWEDHSG